MRQNSNSEARGRRSNRRSFLQQVTLATTALGAGLRGQPTQSLQSFSASLGKDPRLIVHNDRPGVLETPLELLRQHRITPKELLFVRNNQVLEGALTLDSLPLEGWTVEIMGLVKFPREIRGEDLRRYPQAETEMVLQCSGNGRSFYAQSVPTRGTQWQKGGMGNVRWKGVPLRALLEDLKPQVDPRARLVTAEGKDSPPGTAADFEHSLPLDEVLEHGMLALEMNGEPIPAIHGGPVRLIVPGFYGTMNVKWLTRLRFESQESGNYNHVPRYRTVNRPIPPGTAVTLTFENSTPTWLQKVNSAVWTPLRGTRVGGGSVEIQGVAWNDGRVSLETVEISSDAGKTWERAALIQPATPFAWYPWRGTLNLAAGRAEIWVRAIDAAGRAQPLDGSIHWNPSGYEWFGTEKIPLQVF